LRPEEFDYLYQLEETFWWFAGMRQITDAVLTRQLDNSREIRILDAGCGGGFNIVHYSASGSHQVFGLDGSADAIASLRRRGIARVCQADVTWTPYASGAFDVVLSFDVICQGQEPPVEGGLLEMQRVLRPGGYLFVRVPAYTWMRSSHDVEVDTTRRFTRPELARKIAEAGLQVEFISYANCFLFPVVVARRLLKGIGVGKGSDVRPLPTALGWINPVFLQILRFEAALFRRNIPLPFGLSIVCLAQKTVQ
jgi:SAM-dependent methyltransferase